MMQARHEENHRRPVGGPAPFGCLVRRGPVQDRREMLREYVDERQLRRHLGTVRCNTISLVGQPFARLRDLFIGEGEDRTRAFQQAALVETPCEAFFEKFLLARPAIRRKRNCGVLVRRLFSHPIRSSGTGWRKRCYGPTS